jgi:hypothetical protein
MFIPLNLDVVHIIAIIPITIVHTCIEVLKMHDLEQYITI